MIDIPVDLASDEAALVKQLIAAEKSKKWVPERETQSLYASHGYVHTYRLASLNAADMPATSSLSPARLHAPQKINLPSTLKDVLPVNPSSGSSLELELTSERAMVTDARREEWMQHWSIVGRASDIAKESKSAFGPSLLSSVKAGEVLTLSNPQGRVTRFEVRSDCPSLSRSLQRTLERQRNLDLHRSSHYPREPSMERIRMSEVAPATASILAAQAKGGEMSKGAELTRWKLKMGIDVDESNM